jgi:hypothetical protein
VEEEVTGVQIEDDGEKEEEGEEAEEVDHDQQVWHLDEAGEKVCVGQEDIFSWIEAERAELERSEIFCNSPFTSVDILAKKMTEY